MLICNIIIGKVNVLELPWIKVIDILFYSCVELFPKLVIVIIQLFQQKVEIHNIWFFYFINILFNFIQCL